MLKFLLISARPGAAQQAAEYRDFLVNSGLRPWELDHVWLDSEHAKLPDLSPYAGIFIGGSPFNVTTARPTAAQLHIEQELLGPAQSDIPSLYVCFGNSLLTTHFGGLVAQAYQEDAGQTWVELTSAGRKDPLLSNLPLRFTSLTGHTESVLRLPETAELLATGPTCPVQMFRLGNSTWSCQFHADMDVAAMHVRMGFYRNNGYFDPLEFEQVASKVAKVQTKYANQILRNFVSWCTKMASGNVGASKSLLLAAK
ncbi:glutamine amidotransferase [Staphylococcus chromogenes]|nr:glutamine amidotransferase [Staphylococcus chromogenes]